MAQAATSTRHPSLSKRLALVWLGAVMLAVTFSPLGLALNAWWLD